MKNETISIATNELKEILDSYMAIFCKGGKREITDSIFSVYYTWIDREHQRRGGGLKYPKIRVFAKDIETMKRVIKDG